MCALLCPATNAACPNPAIYKSGPGGGCAALQIHSEWVRTPFMTPEGVDKLSQDMTLKVLCHKTVSIYISQYLTFISYFQSVHVPQKVNRK